MAASEDKGWRGALAAVTKAADEGLTKVRATCRRPPTYAAVLQLMAGTRWNYPACWPSLRLRVPAEGTATR